MQRGRTERKHRRVGVRPAPDTMAILTGYLPVEQGIACYAALQKHADTAVAIGDGRTRDQIMADTLVERVTGQATAAEINIELHLIMPLDTLIDPDEPERRRHPRLRSAARQARPRDRASSKGRKWWRRLFTAPKGSRGGADRGRGSDPPLLRRLAQPNDPAARPNLP